MREPIRVLQVVTHMNRGGLETWLMNVYRQLDREKVQLDFLCHRLEPGEYDEEILSLGGKIHRIPPLSLKRFFTYFKNLNTFFSQHPEYTIVHSQLNAMSTPIVWAAKKNAVPVRIAHSRTASAKRDLKLPVRMFFKLFLKRYTTHTFSCSRKAAIFLFGKRHTAAGKVRLFNNAVYPARFTYNETIREQTRDELDLSDKLVVCHVGRFSYPKNHVFLIDVFEKILLKQPNAVLVLVGDGELRTEIEERCGLNGVSERVLFVGKTSEVSKYLQAADVFVFPSHYEGLPNSVIEAQAACLPCVLSDSIDNGVQITGLVQMLSLQKGASLWADAVLEAVKKAPKRKDMQEEIRLQGYDMNVVSQELQQFYCSFN